MASRWKSPRSLKSYTPISGGDMTRPSRVFDEIFNTEDTENTEK
jgi:hypothetical protein